jgi:glutamate racemase
MNKNVGESMKIGIFDSGIGGLSVLHLARRYLPNDYFIYYADEKHVPYGEKTKEEIMQYVDEIIQFMINKGVDVIVIACNTATSVAVKKMRTKYNIPIIGMEPAVKKAIDTYGYAKVLVVATPVTVKGEKLHYLIERFDKDHLVDNIALPKLVRFAEKQEFDSQEVYNYLVQQLSSYHFENYSSIVLGCTHFNYFKDSFRKILPHHIHFVDGNEGTVNHLMQYIKSHEIQGDVEYYYSGEKVTDEKQLERIETYLTRLDQMLRIK